MKKRMTNTINESINTLTDVVDGKIGATVQMTPTEATVYKDTKTVEKHLNDMKDDLDKKANEIRTDSPEEPKVKDKNTYTKTYVLDESLEDFDLQTMSLDDYSDEDDYDNLLDFDMFEFIHKLCVYDVSMNATSNPLADKKKKYNRFANSAEGDYSQIATDRDGNIVLGANETSYFEDIMEILDRYQIDYIGPVATPNADYKFHLTIDVPKLAPNYPMLVGDYFEDIGINPNEVMYDGTWGDRYKKALDKINKENDKELQKRERQRRVDGKEDTTYLRIFKDAVTFAYQRGDISLEDHLKSLYTKLDDAGVRYSKVAVKKKFMDEFEDDEFEDEE